ncbi:MAG: hypothetical protein ABIR71_11945 [Chthoniobacterales bacterium]
MSWDGKFVHVSGTIARVVVETSDRVEKIDHVWIDLETGLEGILRLSLSTCSRQSRNAGFDPRIWVGIVHSSWTELPTPGIEPGQPFNYATLESTRRTDYLAFARRELEQLLIEKAGRALCAEAWGDLYVRGQAGVHQIHSRRASFAVRTDHIGRDGALQFYYDDGVRELLLFKFAGQP